MQQYILSANIAHFRALLENEPDEAKRRILENLLAAEMAKLNEIAPNSLPAVVERARHASSGKGAP